MSDQTYLEHNTLFSDLIKSSAPSKCHHSIEYLATADWMKKNKYTAMCVDISDTLVLQTKFKGTFTHI